MPGDVVRVDRSTLTVNDLEELAGRMGIDALYGRSYGGKRDLYEAMGYKRRLNYRDYLSAYERGPMAAAVIEKPVDACWEGFPEIVESVEEDTDFETAWKEIADLANLHGVFAAADAWSGIGRWSVVFLGFGDGLSFDQPVKPGSSLMYATAYGEGDAAISAVEEDEKNPRVGLPTVYSVRVQYGAKTASSAVHWTRVVHIVQDRLGARVAGTPQLKPVFNRLHDIEILSGAAAEGFWRGSFPGIALTKDDPSKPSAILKGSPAEEELNEQLDDYVYGWRRILRLIGLKAEMLPVTVADPSPQFGVLVDQIAACKQIPKRILLGSERGELSSSQDSEGWLSRTGGRRLNHCEKCIVRPTIARLVDLKSIPAPKTGRYSCNWPTLVARGDKEKADIALVLAQAIATYANSVGAELIVPPEMFLGDVAGFTQDQLTRIEAMLKKVADNVRPMPAAGGNG